MSNHKRTRYCVAKTPANSPRTAIKHRGYEDARAGRAFPREYDDWPAFDQRNYEWGRSLASAMIGELGVAPGWPRNRHIERIVTRGVAAQEREHHTRGVI